MCLFGRPGSPAEHDIVYHTDCSLGKCYSGEAATRHGHIPEMRELEALYWELNALIRSIFVAKRSGRTQEAEDVFKKLVPLSNQIVSLLERIEQKAA